MCEDSVFVSTLARKSKVFSLLTTKVLMMLIKLLAGKTVC